MVHVKCPSPKVLLNAMFFSAAFLAATTSFSEERANVRVVKIVGQAWSLVGNTNKVSLNSADKILAGATILTGNDSAVELLLQDDSILKLGANSKIELPAAGSDSQQMSIRLDQGVTKAIVKKQVGGKRSFAIKTQSTTMGVRGTEFIVEALASGKPMQEVSAASKPVLTEEVMVIRGSVEVSDNSGTRLALVEAGMGFVANMATTEGALFKPGAPQRLAQSQINALKKDAFLVSSTVLATLQLAPPNPGVPVGPGGAQSGIAKTAPPPPLPSNPGAAQPGVSGAAPVASQPIGPVTAPVITVKPAPVAPVKIPAP